jgi:hypothetical protein
MLIQNFERRLFLTFYYFRNNNKVKAKAKAIKKVRAIVPREEDHLETHLIYDLISRILFYVFESFTVFRETKAWEFEDWRDSLALKEQKTICSEPIQMRVSTWRFFSDNEALYSFLKFSQFLSSLSTNLSFTPCWQISLIIKLFEPLSGKGTR